MQEAPGAQQLASAASTADQATSNGSEACEPSGATFPSTVKPHKPLHNSIAMRNERPILEEEDEGVVLLSGDDSLNTHSLNLSLRHLRLSSSNASPRAQEHTADARRAVGDEASAETEREVYSHERAIGPPAQSTAAADRQPWQTSVQQAESSQVAGQVSMKM
jgi:hypothetical protein